MASVSSPLVMTQRACRSGRPNYSARKSAGSDTWNESPSGNGRRRESPKPAQGRRTRYRKQSGRRGPYRQASPRRPGTAPALGLRAWEMCGHSNADQPGKGVRTMSFYSWLQNLRSALAPGRGHRKHGRRASLRAVTHRPTVEVLEARCLPAFLAPVFYAVGSYPYDVKAGDFNGDSILDLVTANIGDNTVSVLLGNPDGTFQPAHTSATGPNAQSVAVGDFNEDGKLDLATANYDYYGDHDVGILLGHGDGTFAPAVHMSNGSTQASQGVATGDLNSDGHEDLVVTSDSLGDETQPFVSVLLGNGDGTFAPAAAYDAIGGGGPPRRCWPTSTATATSTWPGPTRAVRSRFSWETAMAPYRPHAPSPPTGVPTP